MIPICIFIFFVFLREVDFLFFFCFYIGGFLIFFGFLNWLSIELGVVNPHGVVNCNQKEGYKKE